MFQEQEYLHRSWSGLDVMSLMSLFLTNGCYITFVELGRVLSIPCFYPSRYVGLVIHMDGGLLPVYVYEETVATHSVHMGATQAYSRPNACRYASNRNVT